MTNKVTAMPRQAAWECKWARGDDRLRPHPERDASGNLWICVRPTPLGDRRLVSDEECAACEHWELQAG